MLLKEQLQSLPGNGGLPTTETTTGASAVYIKHQLRQFPLTHLALPVDVFLQEAND